MAVVARLQTPCSRFEGQAKPGARGGAQRRAAAVVASVSTATVSLAHGEICALVHATRGCRVTARGYVPSSRVPTTSNVAAPRDALRALALRLRRGNAGAPRELAVAMTELARRARRRPKPTGGGATPVLARVTAALVATTTPPTHPHQPPTPHNPNTLTPPLDGPLPRPAVPAVRPRPVRAASRSQFALWPFTFPPPPTSGRRPSPVTLSLGTRLSLRLSLRLRLRLDRRRPRPPRTPPRPQ